MTPFNMNERVQVQLTDHGRKIYQDQLDAIGSKASKKEDSNGWSTWQLWDLMSVFGGENMDLTSENCFEMDIRIVL